MGSHLVIRNETSSLECVSFYKSYKEKSQIINRPTCRNEIIMRLNWPSSSEFVVYKTARQIVYNPQNN
jgi:hypothetical protein